MISLKDVAESDKLRLVQYVAGQVGVEDPYLFTHEMLEQIRKRDEAVYAALQGRLEALDEQVMAAEKRLSNEEAVQLSKRMNQTRAALAAAVQKYRASTH